MRIYLSSGGLQLFTLIAGVLLPLLVDLATKSTAAPRIKALFLLVLALASSAVADLIAAPDGWDWSAWGWIAAPTFIVAVAALFGLHMPVGTHATAKTAITG